MEIAEPTGVNNKQKYLFFYIIICIATFLIFYPYFNWLIVQWQNDFYDTFGYFVPFISAWIVYTKKNEIISRPNVYSKWGWFFFITGICFTIYYRLSTQAIIGCISLPVVLYGLLLIILGKDRSRCLMLPVFFLIFLYPWGDILDGVVGFHLRLFSVNVTCLIYKCIGMEDAAISGTLLFTGRFLVDIAPACSGLTMMNVLLFMAAIGAYLYKGNKISKFIIFISAIPVTVILNTIRITITGLTGHFFGEDTALSFYHDLSGMIIFGIAILVLYYEARIFKEWIA